MLTILQPPMERAPAPAPPYKVRTQEALLKTGKQKQGCGLRPHQPAEWAQREERLTSELQPRTPTPGDACFLTIHAPSSVKSVLNTKSNIKVESKWDFLT